MTKQEIERAPLCQDCRRRPGLSNVIDAVHLKTSGRIRRLRLCDVCVRERMAAKDKEVAQPNLKDLHT